MREKFRDWKPKGDIRIKYIDGEKRIRYWAINQKALLDQTLEIIKEYSEAGDKLTNRQLYYQLVAANVIPNADEVYKRFCKFLTDARYGGFVDWEDIEDRGRRPSKHSDWNNLKEILDAARRQYRLPRWQDQEFYVEIYCEKEAMEATLKPVADKYHCYFGYNKGYSGAAAIYKISLRVRDRIKHGKKVRILYLGDHDPSGLDMVRDIYDRIMEFCKDTLWDGYCSTCGGGSYSLAEDEDFEAWCHEHFDVIPLALNMEQIKKYGAPPNPAKITDPRAKAYIAKFGSVSWELDALKPPELRWIAEIGIRKYLDAGKYSKWIEKENIEKDKLKEFSINFKE